MTQKREFIENLKRRTKKFAVDVIKFCNSLKTSRASGVITYQIVKSATSTGANYKAVSMARSRDGFLSSLGIVVVEIYKSEYWLEVIKDANLSNDINELNRLLKEANEIHRIMSKARDTAWKSGHRLNFLLMIESFFH